MTRRTWTWVAAAAALGLSACGSSSTSSAAPGQCTPPAKPTTFFKEDVYPILATQCVACHGDNQTARPKFASIDPQVSYSAVKTEVDVTNPPQSRLVTLPRGGTGHPVEMTDAQAATVTKWIGECAQDNSRDTTATTTH